MVAFRSVTIARWFASSLFLVFVAGCGSTHIALHDPQSVARAAQGDPTTIDFQPITLPSETNPVVPGDYKLEPPPPNDVLTTAITGELNARALRGGAPGGYVVQCKLDRFAFRTDTELRYAIAILYSDMNCSMFIKSDHTLVWRGELRGRAVAAGPKNEFDHEDDLWQAYADRTMSDMVRELATDIAVGALHLQQTVSARSFPNEDAEHQTAGVNDGQLGPVALSGDPKTVADQAVPELLSRIAGMRATAWNAVAMASSPDQPWIGGIDTVLDDDAYVRFFQYKALARHGSRATLLELRRAHKRENQDLLKEFLKDAVQSDGLSFLRNNRTPAEAQTTTTIGDDTSP
jgi:hypothetical protein